MLGFFRRLSETPFGAFVAANVLPAFVVLLFFVSYLISNSTFVRKTKKSPPVAARSHWNQAGATILDSFATLPRLPCSDS